LSYRFEFILTSKFKMAAIVVWSNCIILMMKKFDVTVLVQVWSQAKNRSLGPNDALSKDGQGKLA